MTMSNRHRDQAKASPALQRSTGRRAGASFGVDERLIEAARPAGDRCDWQRGAIVKDCRQ
jgi:hypothetical protein